MFYCSNRKSLIKRFKRQRLSFSHKCSEIDWIRVNLFRRCNHCNSITKAIACEIDLNESLHPFRAANFNRVAVALIGIFTFVVVVWTEFLYHGDPQRGWLRKGDSDGQILFRDSWIHLLCLAHLTASFRKTTRFNSHSKCHFIYFGFIKFHFSHSDCGLQL